MARNAKTMSWTSTAVPDGARAAAASSASSYSSPRQKLPSTSHQAQRTAAASVPLPPAPGTVPARAAAEATKVRGTKRSMRAFPFKCQYFDACVCTRRRVRILLSNRRSTLRPDARRWEQLPERSRRRLCLLRRWRQRRCLR
jgi:hypothetical protein